MSGCKPMQYIGSVTNTKGGMRKRLRDYMNINKTGVCRPLKMEKALENGYTISHVGILLLIPFLETSVVPLHRHCDGSRSNTVNTLLCNLGDALEKEVIQYGPRMHMGNHKLEWEGLCSHKSLIEGVRLPDEELEMTSKQLEEKAARKKNFDKKPRQRIGIVQEKGNGKAETSICETIRETEERSRAYAAKRLADMTEEKKESKGYARRMVKDIKRYDCKECGIQYETRSGLIRYNFWSANVEADRRKRRAQRARGMKMFFASKKVSDLLYVSVSVQATPFAFIRIHQL